MENEDEDMVGRVQTAIDVALMDAFDHLRRTGDGPYPDDLQKAARAAIESMREPTRAMVQVAMDDVGLGDRVKPPPTDSKGTYRAMIDAALTPNR